MYDKEKSDIAALRGYLLTQIPTTPLPPNDILLSPNSVALKAAIAGLDKELTRLEREERLVKKFTAANSDGKPTVSVGAGVEDTKRGEDDDMEYVKMTKEDLASSTEDVSMVDKKDEEEWEEANPSPAKKKHARTDNENTQEMEDDRLEICSNLASTAVARIANDNIKVETPLGALGLALHAALVELNDDINGNTDPIFRCTGVPDLDVTFQLTGMTAVKGKKGGGGGGFAAPIRELPRSQLVPSEWERTERLLAFRYKCGKEVYSTDHGHTNDATTVYLTLRLLEGSKVSVTFGTLPSNKGGAQEKKKLDFPLAQHVNLDGFQAAKAKNGGGSVSPSLFYISLPNLLLEFSSIFGVLPKKVQSGVEAMGPATKSEVLGQFDRTVPMPGMQTVPKVNTSRPNIPPDGPAIGTSDHTDPLRVMDSRRKKKHSDFEGDLLPGGPQPGGLHEMPPRGTGSQVGPNHPMFDRNFGDDGLGYNGDDLGFGEGGGSFGVPGIGGGTGMRPRFDPYGPPGGPTEPGRGGGRFPGRLGSGRGRGGRGRGRMPPGGFGGPNNDHMPPPGGDYFS